MQLPKLSILSIQRNVGGECDHCGRHLKHVVLIRDNETNTTMNLGTGCVKSMSGKTLKQIYAEEKAYKIALKEFDIETNAKIRVQNFKELNEDMMNYIEKNQDNQFLRSMKTVIEETGTLTTNMYAVVYSMMLPVAQLSNKVKDLQGRVIRIKEGSSNFGYRTQFNYTLFCDVNGELVRVFFSSDEMINDLGLRQDNVFDLDIKININGTFDGYKVKRAKISKVA